MQCSPLDAPFGAQIQLDVDGPLSFGEGEELRRLFAEHGLLVLRGAEISRELQIELVSRLGRIEPDVTAGSDQTAFPQFSERGEKPSGISAGVSMQICPEILHLRPAPRVNFVRIRHGNSIEAPDQHVIDFVFDQPVREIGAVGKAERLLQGTVESHFLA